MTLEEEQEGRKRGQVSGEVRDSPERKLERVAKLTAESLAFGDCSSLSNFSVLPRTTPSCGRRWAEPGRI